MAKAADVAAAIMERLGEDETTTMKMQKMLYYCQGWHLAWDNEPLFSETIEAWANGPVVRDIYDRHRGQFCLTPAMVSRWGEAGELKSNELESVHAVVDHYRGWTADEMSVATHGERPWRLARHGLGPTERGKNPICPHEMHDFFTALKNELVTAGE